MGTFRKTTFFRLTHLQQLLGLGLVVSTLAFFSDDASQNPANVNILIKKNENKTKETEVGPF